MHLKTLQYTIIVKSVLQNFLTQHVSGIGCIYIRPQTFCRLVFFWRVVAGCVALVRLRWVMPFLAHAGFFSEFVADKCCRNSVTASSCVVSLGGFLVVSGGGVPGPLNTAVFSLNRSLSFVFSVLFCRSFIALFFWPFSLTPTI